MATNTVGIDKEVEVDRKENLRDHRLYWIGRRTQDVILSSLALVVLYNLTNINITEREKEIATIKVLGFYDPEVYAYVNRESVALTLIGTLLGLAGGIALHSFVITTVEVDAVMFGRQIYPQSFAYAIALTLLFSTLVNLVMQRLLKRISMVESMKAPE